MCDGGDSCGVCNVNVNVNVDGILAQCSVNHTPAVQFDATGTAGQIGILVGELQILLCNLYTCLGS